MLCTDRFFIFPDIVRLSVMALSPDASGIRRADRSSEHVRRICCAGGRYPDVLRADIPQGGSDRQEPVLSADGPVFHLSCPVCSERRSDRYDCFRASAECMLRTDRRLLSVCPEFIRRCFPQGQDLWLWICRLCPDDLGDLPHRQGQFSQVSLVAASLCCHRRSVRMAWRPSRGAG